VGAVRAAEPLNGGVGAPAGFEHVMDAQPLIPDAEIRMVGAAGAAGVGEHQDALVVILEGLRLGEVGRSGAVLHGQAVDAGAAGTGGSEARCSMRASRRSTASRQMTGLPSSLTTGREAILPSASEYSSN